MTMPITLTIAGSAALLNVWLGFRVSQMRRLHKVSIGHGGKSVIATRMRAHANFVEYTPFFLILLGLVEMARGSRSEEHTSELQSLMRISYAVFCLKKKISIHRLKP